MPPQITGPTAAARSSWRCPTAAGQRLAVDLWMGRRATAGFGTTPRGSSAPPSLYSLCRQVGRGLRSDHRDEMHIRYSWNFEFDLFMFWRLRLLTEAAPTSSTFNLRISIFLEFTLLPSPLPNMRKMFYDTDSIIVCTHCDEHATMEESN